MARRSLTIFLIFSIIAFLTLPSQVGADGGKVLVFKVSGTISMAHSEALIDALDVAYREGYSAVVLMLSTPGGSLDSTLRMITAIENSPVPVIGYVYPPGTTAWSAGTYLLMATHVAAMAPHTIIGSCQPIAYSPLGSQPVNDTKILNAVISVMATQAKAHGRNETLAIRFITENVNVNDEEAQAQGVIEFRAESLETLLNTIHGLEVKTAVGTVKLNTKGATVTEYSFRIRDSVINVVSDPTISSLLFLIGIFALIYGLSAPGHGGEILGAAALLLALIGMGFDVNMVSLIMMAAGAILLIYELATPGFGVFGFSGIILLTIGALFIVPFTPEKWAISGEWYATFTYSIVAATLVIAGIFVFIIIKILQVRRRPPVIGRISGEVLTSTEDAPPNEVAFIIYRGEYWQAKCDKGLKKGKKYKIVGKDGPVLILEEVVETP
ncbi:MAG: nodulation protein NfeD [Candidatus Methanomethylicia archaeon]|jgi:membrane-bound serine protease (ClpP class)|nr:nodulation protein NfeD [Candidatus Methanomethylicia archaeon]